MNYPSETRERKNASEASTFSSALREAGINEALIAKKLKRLLGAKHRRWNTKKKSWDEFDDCETQLAATREIVKLFGGYLSESEEPRFTWINDVFPPRCCPSGNECSEYGERCQADTTASGTGPDVLGNRTTSKS
jgi:hypothetical protein